MDNYCLCVCVSTIISCPCIRVSLSCMCLCICVHECCPSLPSPIQYPPVMFTEDYQLQFHANYFATFDEYHGKFLIGELIWNFADFMTDQGEVYCMKHFTAGCTVIALLLYTHVHITCVNICTHILYTGMKQVYMQIMVFTLHTQTKGGPFRF